MPRPKKQKPNRKDGLYEVKITLGKTLQGKLIRKSFYSNVSKEDAIKKAEQYKIEMAVAERTGEAFCSQSMAFDKWARQWLKTYKLGKVKGNTYIGSYQEPVELHLIPYFGCALLTDIRPQDVQAFFNQKSNTSALESIKKMRACLSAIFDTAIENDLCRKNPVTRNIKIFSKIKPKEKRAYTQEQYSLVLEYAKEVHALDIWMLLETGISRSELLGIKWEDFDEKENVIYIEQGTVQYTDPETDKWVLSSEGLKNEYRRRPIPISPELAQQLREKPHIIMAGGNKKRGIPPHPVKTTHIFHSPTGCVYSPTNWDKRTYKVFMDKFLTKHPDMPALTPHELRHTRATIWEEQGIDLFVNAKLLGHADLRMLAKRYAHSNVGSLKRALGYDKD